MNYRHQHRCRLVQRNGALAASELIDQLATADDQLWPVDRWPVMAFPGGGVAVGEFGGHGPVRYEIEAYEPGRLVRFRFREMGGLTGFHAFAVEPGPGGTDWLEHDLQVSVRGRWRLLWPLAFGPLHDALLRDALAGAAAATDGRALVREPFPLGIRVLYEVARRATATPAG